MPLTSEDWHQRFEIQSHWTKSTRDYLFERIGFSRSDRILDVGCGTGVISADLIHSNFENLSGIDLNLTFLNLAAFHLPMMQLYAADAHKLPFNDKTFDYAFCHYLLMWITDPAFVIHEMKRVTRSGGAVLALAEPDYGGRIDYPEPLTILNEWQTASLRDQGANPQMGRRLKALFHQANLRDIEVGVIGAHWKEAPDQDELSSEWDVIRSDLVKLKNNSEDHVTSEEIEKIDRAAWELGERVLYVPTFFAVGFVE